MALGVPGRLRSRIFSTFGTTRMVVRQPNAPASFTPRTLIKNGKGVPRQAEVALGVPGRLRPRIFSIFGTTRMVVRQPNAQATFIPGEIPGTHFSEAESTSGHMVLSEVTTEKIPIDTTGDFFFPNEFYSVFHITRFIPFFT